METNPKIKIECLNLSKSFVVNDTEEAVLQDVSLEVYDNEFLVILGPGQCGKTTLLKCIAGLYGVDTGQVLLNGALCSGPGPDRGMVFQRYGLFPWKTVFSNVAFGLEIQGVSRKERYELAQRYIDLVGLGGVEKSYPSQLSGGMKQRVAIARAYASAPEVLLMDEPFGALDAQTRYAMEKEILEISQRERRTIIFVTNNIEEAIYLGDRVVVLSPLPGSVKAVYPIHSAKPRNYTDKQFLEMRKLISNDTELSL